jgi:transcriptional regulator with XRE-family HTH domain
MLFRQALADVIATHRKENNLTLRQMTISRGQVHLSYNYLWELERGSKDPSSEILEQIAKCMRVDTADLILKVGLVMSKYSIPDTAQELLDTASDLVSR